MQSPEDPHRLNRYAYARNNPLVFVDPTGYDFWSDFYDFYISLGEALTAAVVGIAVGYGTTGAGLYRWGGVIGAFSGNLA